MPHTPSYPRLSAATGLRLTPQNHISPSHHPGKCTGDNGDCHLSVKTVIGTTTCSANGFDCLVDSFAAIAGSAVILTRIDSDLNVTRRFFRARHNPWPHNSSSASYSPATPPTGPELRHRLISPQKSVRAGSPLGDLGESHTARQRTKAATCISLSPDGRFLALGEVRSAASSAAPIDQSRQDTTRGY